MKFLRKIYRAIKQIDRHIGNRGSALAVFGFMMVGVGQGYLTGKVSNASALKMLEYVAPHEVWGAFWVLSGFIALAAVFYKRLEPLAFGLTCTILSLWGFQSALLWILHQAPTGWVGAFVFLALARLAYKISVWQENRDGDRR